jgi:hypothetical protein
MSIMAHKYMNVVIVKKNGFNNLKTNKIMTPKEKAEELIEYAAETIEPIQFGIILERNWKSAKQCALIAVDETLNALYSIPFGNALDNELEYWEEVKQEIKNK